MRSYFLLSFISSLDFRPLFVPTEANWGKCLFKEKIEMNVGLISIRCLPWGMVSKHHTVMICVPREKALDV